MRRAFVHRKAPLGPDQFHLYLDKTPKRMKEKNPQGASFHRDVHLDNLISLFNYFFTTVVSYSSFIPPHS